MELVAKSHMYESIARLMTPSREGVRAMTGPSKDHPTKELLRPYVCLCKVSSAIKKE